MIPHKNKKLLVACQASVNSTYLDSNILVFIVYSNYVEN